MDFDSSAKFISSLAKFLQSLCNGYVEFDNGVEVIGHIYLNVDTGKKIDYVLNEKVCKTDENSVTFISNSFHAQPAEKPKPPEKPKPVAIEPEPESDNVILLEDDSPSHFDQFNDISHQNSPSAKPTRPQGASKRPYSSQSFPSARHSPKVLKFDSSHSNGVPSNTATDRPGRLAAPPETDHESQVFSQSANDSSISQDRDIKPVLDKDMNVVDVKQEFVSSNLQETGDMYDDPGDDSYYSQDQSYEASNDQYFAGVHQDQSLKFNYDPSKMYAGEQGQAAGDTQETVSATPALRTSGNGPTLYKCAVAKCAKRMLSFFAEQGLRRHWRDKHEAFRQVFRCSLCYSNYKRKSDAYRHIRTVHKEENNPMSLVVIPRNLVPNRQFIDPFPLTLEEMLKK